jgi:hypothetical protein
MVVTLSWFVVANGGITNIPWDVAEVVGIGIVIIVIGRVFAG